MKTFSPDSSVRAFTLIELLTVIAIIVVLMGILLPALQQSKIAAAKTAARSMTQIITTAVNSYEVEYGHLPPTDLPPKEDGQDLVLGETTVGAVQSNNVVFDALRNIPRGPNTDYQANPKRVVYFEERVARASSQGKPRTGFYDPTAGAGAPPADLAGSLYDPFGHQYGVALDTTGDGRIDLTGFYQDFSGANPVDGLAPRSKVGAFSMGPDEKLGKDGNRALGQDKDRSDDQVSWQEIAPAFGVRNGRTGFSPSSATSHRDGRKKPVILKSC